MEDLGPGSALVSRLPETVAGRDVPSRVTAGRAERSVRIRLMWLQNIDGPGTQVTHQGALQRCPCTAAVEAAAQFIRAAAECDVHDVRVRRADCKTDDWRCAGGQHRRPGGAAIGCFLERRRSRRVDRLW